MKGNDKKVIGGSKGGVTLKSRIGSMVGSTRVNIGSCEGRPEFRLFRKRSNSNEKRWIEVGIDMRRRVVKRIRTKEDRQGQWTKLSVGPGVVSIG